MLNYADILSVLQRSVHVVTGRFAPKTFGPKLTVLGISPSRRGRTGGRFADLRMFPPSRNGTH